MSEHQEIKMSKQYEEHMNWVFQDGVPAWQRFNTQRVVSMAACIVDGHLIVGNRHFCPIMQMTLDSIGGRDTRGKHDILKDQGFVDQYGVWMSRKEAYYVAKEAGQLKFHRECDGDTLYSESYL